MHRRSFLQAASGIAALPILGAEQAVSILPHQISTAPPQWAAEELRKALAGRGVNVTVRKSLSDVPRGEFCVVAAHFSAPLAQEVLKRARLTGSAEPEALAIATGQVSGRPVLLAAGHEDRGLVYALLELADRANLAPEPVRALSNGKSIAEKPANRIRSMSRAFVSDVEDKPWFNDREMWPEYLTMLASQRFNRFNLCLSLGYDFMRQVTDAYLLFPYPFLFEVPGYNVRATNLPDSERDANLEMLRFISEETVKRGLDFQLGLWTHAYEWIDTPKANHYIEGLNAQNHANYCRDALAHLLKSCPAITGLTLRIHGESGVPEGSYDFWRTIFGAIANCGRRIEIDMHAKGMDQSMIDVALETKQPVVISPKYWAEHFGLPYHQAAIRSLEMPHVDRDPNHGGLMKISAGSRSFLRYGYGDLLKEDRNYKVMFRVFPGAVRHLLWGDPQIASACAKITSFCGADGIEFHEPLFFKGRRGSGLPGGRNAYLDTSLNPKWDWQKFDYYYRVWGRNLYNPSTDPEPWRRYLTKEFKEGAPAAELALANASRVIPTFLTSHGPSAAHNSYWVEMYVNMSLLDPKKHHYSDTLAPKVFGNVSPFDPQLFSRMNDCAKELVNGQSTAKYLPVEVASWLEQYAASAEKHLSEAKKLAPKSPEFRRFAIDTEIQIGLGKFFASKLRAGVLFGIFQETGDREALKQSIRMYQSARSAWADFSLPLRTIYRADVTYGGEKFLRGHWADRLPAIDEDIASLSAVMDRPDPGKSSKDAGPAIKAALATVRRADSAGHHSPPAHFSPGQPIRVEVATSGPAEVKLFYRHVDQAELYESIPLSGTGDRYSGEIPAEYTKTDYPVQYYFEIHNGGESSLFPGLGPNLTDQPYYVVRRA